MKKILMLLFGLVSVMLMAGCLSLEGIFPFLNSAPVIISEPITTATEDQLYSYQIQAVDSNDDELSYFLTIKPEGMSIDKESGLMSWVPTNNQVGAHPVNILVSDDMQSSATQNFDVEVSNVNNSPQIISYSPANSNIKINEGDSVKFEIQAHDIDLNPNLSYRWFLNGKEVSNHSVLGNDSISSWTYSAGSGDCSQKTIKVLVSDGELYDYNQWNITINDITPPTQPTLNIITSPTNISYQVLSGTKESNTSIIINGIVVISLNPSTDWSYSYHLSEGTNNLSITSSDAAGNESSANLTLIEYDPNTYVDIENISGIEDGTQTYPFNSICEAIEAATPGKSVIVAAGTYNEQLIVNKSITLRGASRDNTFISGGGLSGNLISLQADNITISGFTIESASSASTGIYFDSYSSIDINNNLIKNNKDYGINYSNSAPIIEDNNIENNSSSGIKVATGGAGIIENNSILSNLHGIRTYEDSCPEIKGNNVRNNNTGILCRGSATPIISYNNIHDNTAYGILIDDALGDAVNPDIGGGDKGSEGQNKITGNFIHGISNKTTHNIYAKDNWWGDTAGPKYPGNPNNAAISSDWAYWDVTKGKGPINFSPYLSVEP
ncbi:MAG TPA: DUF1565 domain-containing protein [Candidatus Atribacteria bacterium]|nr:DUF1565 domain-containing protein [Candidatus Atribacteria bacterium]